MLNEDDFSFPIADNISGNVQEIVNAEKKGKKKDAGSFYGMNLSKDICKAIQKMGYRNPTPIQRKCIPVVLSGKDVVAMARTGSGKTAAFVLPMLQKLERHSTTVGCRALVIAPTRELIKQTEQFIEELGKFKDLRTCCLIGGESIEKQFEGLAQNPDIIVATPGRLLHIISETGLSLKAVEYIVFDEADRLFEMGLKEQILEVLSKIPSSRQTLLISATLPSILAEFVQAGLNNAEFIRLDVESKLSENLRLSYFNVRSQDKFAALLYILRRLVREDEQTIIFACTRHHCEFLRDLLECFDIPAIVIYGSMDQSARLLNMAKFKNKTVMTMITTDVAARGIDVPNLDNVINFDFPPKPKIFVHRVGRAARAGRNGTAFSIVAPDEIPALVELHMFLGRHLVNKVAEDKLEEEAQKKEECKGDKRKLLNYYDGFFGSIPQRILDSDTEEIQRFIHDKSELNSLSKVCERAFKLYSSTRPAPAPESIRRAKKLEQNIHPLFIGESSFLDKEFVNDNQEDMMSQIRGWKPNQTVFEVGVHNTKTANMMLQRRTFKAVKDAFRPKKKKEETDAMQISDEEQEESDDDGTLASRLLSKASMKKRFLLDPNQLETKKSFKDEQFYISVEPTTAVNEFEEKGLRVNEESYSNDPLKAASMDLMAEDNESLLKKKQVMQWDKKKKKYVMVNPAAEAKKKRIIKNESGALVKDGDKVDLYASWKKKTHVRIQRVGEQENAVHFRDTGSNRTVSFDGDDSDDNQESKAPAKKNFNKKQPQNRKRKANDELRNPDQIKKARLAQHKKAEEQQIREKMKKHGAAKVKQQIQQEGMAKALKKRGVKM